MSNLLSTSNKLGPGFDRGSFFTDVVEIDFAFYVNRFFVARLRSEQSVVYTPGNIGPSLLYQPGIREYPYESTPSTMGLIFMDIKHYPVQTVNLGSNTIVASTVNINIVIS